MTEGWVAVELMDHSVVAGYGRIVAVGRDAVLRVDVPSSTGYSTEHAFPLQAIFCWTPIAEEEAMEVALRWGPRRVPEPSPAGRLPLVMG